MEIMNLDDIKKEKKYDSEFNKLNENLINKFNNFMEKKFSKYKYYLENIKEENSGFANNNKIKYHDKNDLIYKLKQNNDIKDCNNTKLLSLYKFLHEYINREINELTNDKFSNVFIRNRNKIKDKFKNFNQYRLINKINISNENDILNIISIYYKNWEKNIIFYEKNKKELLNIKFDSLIIYEKDDNINEENYFNIKQLYDENFFDNLVNKLKEYKENHLNELKKESEDIFNKLNLIKKEINDFEKNNLFEVYFNYINEKLNQKRNKTIVNFPFYILIKNSIQNLNKLKKDLLLDIINYIKEENYIFKMVNYLGFFKYSIYPKFKNNCIEFQKSLETNNLHQIYQSDKLKILSINKWLKINYENFFNLLLIKNIQNNSCLFNYIEEIISINLDLINTYKNLVNKLKKIQNFLNIDNLIKKFEDEKNMDNKKFFVQKINNFLLEYENYGY